MSNLFRMLVFLCFMAMTSIICSVGCTPEEEKNTANSTALTSERPETTSQKTETPPVETEKSPEQPLPPLEPAETEPESTSPGTKNDDAASAENAPPAEESDLMKEFEKISIGPNQVFITDQLQGENKQTWLQAANDGFQEMRKAFFSLYKDLNGWALCPRHMGDYGQDYLYRAYIALTGLGGLVPEEAIYLPNIRKKGTPTLSGQNRYLLHFDKNNLPPVGAFWSLAMYEITMDRRQYFAQNPINRYSIGNFTDGIQYNSDGSLDIYIQNQLPVHDRESNWLPAPEGNFSMVMRAFEPEPSIINGEYQFPEIQILGSSL